MSFLYYTPPVSSKHFHPPIKVVRALSTYDANFKVEDGFKESVRGSMLSQEILDFTPS